MAITTTLSEFDYVRSTLEVNSHSRNPDKFMAKCPAHDDGSPSLSVARGEGGRAIFHCFAGCGWKDIRHAIGLPDKGADDWRDFKPQTRIRRIPEKPPLPDLTLARVAHYEKGLHDAMPFITEQWGIDWETAKEHHMGYTKSCPTMPGVPSITFPYYWRGRLVNIRHRLLNTEKGKYRPEKAGLPSMLYNADNIKYQKIFLVEGEAKAIHLSIFGLAAVGIPGKQTFKPHWAGLFRKTETVIILDPDALSSAVKIAGYIARRGGKVSVAQFPDKIDDWFIANGEYDALGKFHARANTAMEYYQSFDGTIKSRRGGNRSRWSKQYGGNTHAYFSRA